MGMTSPMNTIANAQPITPMVDGIPIDFIRYFDIDIRNIENRDKSQLQEIYSLLDGAKRSPSDMLTELRNIQNKLGAPGYHETKFGKIWNYLKITRHINNLEKERKSLEVGD